MNARARFPAYVSAATCEYLANAAWQLRMAAAHLDKAAEFLTAEQCDRLNAIPGHSKLETLADVIDAFAGEIARDQAAVICGVPNGGGIDDAMTGDVP